MNIQFAVAAACMILCLFPDRVLARQEQSRVDCGTPDHCVRSLYEYVKANEPISGLPSPVERIIHKLADYGDAVVPSLVDLLADPDVEVTNMAGAALREIESIEPRHLPQIIEGLDRGVHWLPAALGRIDSPEAAKEAVYRYLVSRSKPYNQEAYAVKLSGERAIPYVLEVAGVRAMRSRKSPVPRPPDPRLLGRKSHVYGWAVGHRNGRIHARGNCSRCAAYDRRPWSTRYDSRS